MPSPLKFFRVAVEGATTDGRTIDRTIIQQMADSYDPDVYGARIWMEHYRSAVADSPFKAYGDIRALKAEEIDMLGRKKLALFAQIDPTQELIAMSKARQKIYTSLEINPKFADTGLPYLNGLGVTDSPASLGTEILKFAVQNKGKSPFTARKDHPDNLFSEAIEIELSFDETTQSDPEVNKLSKLVTNMISRFSSKKSSDDSRFADMTEAIETLVNHIEERDEKFSAAEKIIDTLQRAMTTVSDDFSAFKKQMDTEDQVKEKRPAANGGGGEQQTDF